MILSRFSNNGEVVDIVASGDIINYTILNGKYAKFSDTSIASSHVTGAVALYKSSHPDATPTEIFNQLIQVANTPNIACDTAAKNGKGYIENGLLTETTYENHFYT